MDIKPLTIFKWDGKLVEVNATADGPIVFFKYLKVTIP